MSIVVRHLSKAYGEQTAVNRVSFEVHKGQIVGFLGPNGAGKSTTMKMITGFIQPDHGEVIVEGVNVVAQPLRAKSRIGYLPESNPLYHDLFVREYLKFVADVHQLRSNKEQVEKAIARVGLTSESNKRIGQLSKGYKQRVGLAAALVHNPDVLILDEPTTGLDPNQILEIREVIKNQGREKTVLFSSHILQEVEAICDRVIIISQGQIVADETIDSLQKKQHAREVHATFDQQVDPDAIEKLPEVIGVSSEKNRDGSFSFRIMTNNPEVVRKQLLELSLRQNLNIVSLQSKQQSLEEVFRSLTNPSPGKNKA